MASWRVGYVLSINASQEGLDFYYFQNLPQAQMFSNYLKGLEDLYDTGGRYQGSRSAPGESLDYGFIIVSHRQSSAHLPYFLPAFRQVESVVLVSCKQKMIVLLECYQCR